MVHNYAARCLGGRETPYSDGGHWENLKTVPLCLPLRGIGGGDSKYIQKYFTVWEVVDNRLMDHEPEEGMGILFGRPLL